MDDYLKDFTLLEELGRGGQKTVYLAKNSEKPEVVIKIGAFDSMHSLERIRREVEFLKNDHSGYFPRVYDFKIDFMKNQFLIVEEFISKTTLRKKISGPSSIEDVRKVLLGLLNPLKTIWEQGIVHRDVKPENILITDDGLFVLIDLGIAKFNNSESLTALGTFQGPGSYQYSSPEQLLNHQGQIGPRSDMFSLAIVMLELYYGVHPFDPGKAGGMSITENILNGNYYISNELKNHPMIKYFKKSLSVEQYKRYNNSDKIIEDLQYA
ncbi:serine/threonine protein kinase [Leptospira stimsonii]|uniref:serine/threonine protein kinase n=1 Tax=Leptospira stimsonii TaxID=2202203 RepID=UPI0019D603FD|nr:serine/threonine-protein kinase [Leptospira stimsonii]